MQSLYPSLNRLPAPAALHDPSSSECRLSLLCRLTQGQKVDQTRLMTKYRTFLSGNECSRHSLQLLECTQQGCNCGELSAQIYLLSCLPLQNTAHNNLKAMAIGTSISTEVSRGSAVMVDVNSRTRTTHNTIEAGAVTSSSSQLE